MRLLTLLCSTVATLFTVPARADGFADREIVYQALNAIDAAQTCHIINSGKGIEGNPAVRLFIGKNPSCEKVIGFKLVSGLAHYLFAKHLNNSNTNAAKGFQIVSIVIQGGVVVANFKIVF